LPRPGTCVCSGNPWNISEIQTRTNRIAQVFGFVLKRFLCLGGRKETIKASYQMRSNKELFKFPNADVVFLDLNTADAVRILKICFIDIAKDGIFLKPIKPVW